MFPRRERLPRAILPAVLKGGRRVSSLNFSAVVSQEARGVAVVVPKKVARLSVTRHTIKRRVLAALRELSLPPALVIFPKASASSVSYQEAKSELRDLLSKTL